MVSLPPFSEPPVETDTHRRVPRPASSQTDFEDTHILPSVGRASSLQATPPQSMTFCKDPSYVVNP